MGSKNPTPKQLRKMEIARYRARTGHAAPPPPKILHDTRADENDPIWQQRITPPNIGTE